jgi:uncharacterized protein YbjT (DUF2867 family)
VKVIVFGATGMVGQGVVRECLLDDEVTDVLAVGRSSTGQTHEKVRELIHKDFTDFSSVADDFAAYDACFFCLGVSAVGMSEVDYRRVTFDLTLAAARPLAERNHDMTFVYVSGSGTDGTGKGRSMWARVKGETENAVLALPFRGYAFRPGFIQPMHGIRPRVPIYRAVYTVVSPLNPLLRRFPRFVTTTEQVGRAMIRVARDGADKRIIESVDIAGLAG